MITETVQTVGGIIDLAGVFTIAAGLALATVLAVWRLYGREPQVYRRYRQDVGRGILLGLELLIAADIIRTVAISPTLESVAVLAGIVLVRMLLSFVLELEIGGRWPWQRRDGRDESQPDDS